MRCNPLLRSGLLSAAGLFSGLVLMAQTPKMVVDHRYTPPWWQSLICLPDDPVKTLVGREGQLFGDYNYPGPRHFSFSLQLDNASPETWKSQQLVDATVPMTHTVKMTGAVKAEETTFLEIPAPEALNSIVRYDSRKILRGFSKPSEACDSAFTDVAVGEKGLSGEGIVEFHIKVQPGSTGTVALGFCEGKYDSSGKRPMRVTVEGSPYRDIDPVRDFGFRKPGVVILSSKDEDGDGILTVVVANAPGAKDRDAIVNAVWLFSGDAPDGATIVSGRANSQAALYAPAAKVRMPARRYHMLVTATNTGKLATTYHPLLKYNGIESLDASGDYIRVGDETRIYNTTGTASIKKDSANHFTVKLGIVPLAAGESKSFAVVMDRFSDPAQSYTAGLENSIAQQATAKAWWEKNSPSASAISVPDSGVQSMIESCIRNIFQSRDIRKGKRSFSVGPTEYRGLWLADGSFLLEVATMLGYKVDVRSCIDYLETYQLPTGGFEMITTFHKENGLVPFMVIRHAQLTQDKEWLNKNWSVVEGCLKRIQYLRDSAKRDPAKSYYGLLPDGNVDGGIQHGDDYSNTEWCLSGMKWAIWAAHWLGKEEQANKWQGDYDDFYNTFIKMAQRDMRKDDKGNRYLPVMIRNEQNHNPARGQWAFCQSVYPGQIFDSPAVAKTMALGTVKMLHDHRVEGEVYNTGWMTDGLWSYFSSFYGHAMLWLGQTESIPQLLYDYANHSSPTMVWREEQQPVGKGHKEVGDMPHNWASAEFIRMTVHMIEFDRGNELHLFEALPGQWLKPGAAVRLNELSTPFGRINLSLTVDSEGKTAVCHLQFLDEGHLPSKLVIHRNTWSSEKTSIGVPVQPEITQTIKLQ